MLSAFSSSWFSGSWYEGLSASSRVAGYTSTWASIAGPRAARARWVMIAARFPPALSPATTSGAPSAASSARWASTQASAAQESSTAVGYGCSGAIR